jgi:predicted nucleic acid-binding protein
MILLDTNVLIYAADAGSRYGTWAQETIADAVSAHAAAINTVTLAELCMGDAQPATLADRVRSWGVVILDLPAASAEACAAAYVAYCSARKTQSGKDSSTVPLPDFFIGAHAQIMGWPLATADEGRFKTYFPSVPLKTPGDTR